MWRDSRLLALCLLLGAGGNAAAQDLIVLRNTTLIRDRVAVSADPDGLRLDDGRLIGWDDIETARVSPELQPEVTELLAALGPPLFRIRHRLKVGDYAGVLAPAEEVHRQFLSRATEMGLMVSQALMWGRLEAGRREEALLAHLECLAKLRVRPRLADSLPGARRPQLDLKTGLSDELAPVWFDAEAAAKVKPEVLSLAAKLPAPRPPGVYLYCATLCLAAGDRAMTQRMISAVPEPRAGRWGLLLQAQAEAGAGRPGPAVSRLRQSLGEFDEQLRPLAQYWLARAELLRQQPPAGDEQALEMLTVAAVFGPSRKELGAAALHHTMRHLQARGRDAEATRVRRELLEGYGGTHYARQAAEPP